jgi:hypothetical protein
MNNGVFNIRQKQPQVTEAAADHADEHGSEQRLLMSITVQFLSDRWLSA